MTRKGCRGWPPAICSTALWILAVAICDPARALGGDTSEKFVLREALRASDPTQVRIELKAQGLFRPGLPPGRGLAEDHLPKPLTLEVETRLIFLERLVQMDQEMAGLAAKTGQVPAGTSAPAGGRTLRAVRQVLQAASAINGEVRPTTASLRPEVGLLVAERRDSAGPVVVVSPNGPLTRAELELVQGLGDPLALGELLPVQPVARGEGWRVRSAAAQAISGYDSITSDSLEATLEAIDPASARVRLKGRIQGSALGGRGTMMCAGSFTFDRRLARIDRLEVNRDEVRQPGPIEAGLDVKSTLSVTRQSIRLPSALSDAALAGVPLTITPQRELLRLPAPDGKSSLLHDRQWHVFWEDPKLTVLKRLDQGAVVAQCNIAPGPLAGKGRHQDPNQFRDDIRRGLKQRFVRLLGAGEVDGDPAGGFRYKVGVEGRAGDLGVVWYYYLVASSEGDQLLATFTLAANDVQAFGNQDLEMIGSLRWHSAAQPAPGGERRGIGQTGRSAPR